MIVAPSPVLALPLVVLPRPDAARATYAVDCGVRALRVAPLAAHAWASIRISAVVALAVREARDSSRSSSRAARDVRWSANRAALLAAIVYALVIPAMIRTPIDGDEPFYLLLTESIVRDFDLDLAQPVRATHDAPERPHRSRAAARRPDRAERRAVLAARAVPPAADGARLLSSAGLHGALATIALFGVLLVRSTVRWMEDEGIADAADPRASSRSSRSHRRCSSTRRGSGPRCRRRSSSSRRCAACAISARSGGCPRCCGLVLLKLRFVLVAVGLLACGRMQRERAARRGTLALHRADLAVLVIPLLIAYFDHRQRDERPLLARAPPDGADEVRCAASSACSSTA